MPKDANTVEPASRRQRADGPGATVFEPPRSVGRQISDDIRLARLKRFVDGHYADPLPLAKAADVACLEKTYFSRYFRRKAGICFHEWLHWIRVNRAIELMRTSDATVTEIAFAVGYQDLRTFERAFYKCTGRCPKAVRQQVQAELRNQPCQPE